jgi:ERCC4-type nuclease
VAGLIIIDTREKADIIIKVLDKYNVAYEIEKLEIADYFITGGENNVLAERKTWSDFIGAIYSGRLFEQLVNMNKVENAEKVLVIEGSFGLVKKFHMKVNYNTIVGALNSVLFDFKIPIIHSFSQYFTALLLVSMNKRLGETREKKELIMSKPKAESIEEEVLRVVASFPMISEKRAREILAYFGSIHKFVNNVDEIDKIEGIGEKIKNKIKGVICYEVKK